MADFLKKIVRKQSRSSSPTKRRTYEQPGPWDNFASIGHFGGPYYQPSASKSQSVQQSSSDNNYNNICRLCHNALHDYRRTANQSMFLPMTPMNLDLSDQLYHPDNDNQYPHLFSNSYHYGAYNNQFWKPKEKTPPTSDVEVGVQVPSSSEPHSKETIREKDDAHKTRKNTVVHDSQQSVCVDASTCTAAHSKDYYDCRIPNDNIANPPIHSHSPKKSITGSPEKPQRKSRSKSPSKKARQVGTVHNYLSPQCQHEGCSAAIFVEDTKFLVCKQQLSHVSEYFRSLFIANRSIPITGASQNSLNEFSIVVSSFTHPPPATQFKWFLESVIQAPILKDITDDTLETLMRLSKRFRAPGLEMRCARYIQENVNKKTPMIALCWLNWVLKHKFDKVTHDACLPRVATSSLVSLEEHRNMITEKLLADLFAAKLRALYAQAVSVFQTIHGMDHFYVDVERCPRCGRQREQGRVRIYVSPCKRAIGCERCSKEKECEIMAKTPGSFQAFYQCEHGLIPLNERTPDCQCQVSLLASKLSEELRIDPDLNSENNE